MQEVYAEALNGYILKTGLGISQWHPQIHSIERSEMGISGLFQIFCFTIQI